MFLVLYGISFHVKTELIDAKQKAIELFCEYDKEQF